MNFEHPSASRRTFLKSAAALAAASTLPKWFVEECAAQPAPASPTSPNDQPGIALIGCGGRGRGVAKDASKYGRMVAVCDVDDAHIALAKKMWPDVATHKDFREVVQRKDVDVIICGSVDHWHTLISIAAMRAGKDVYCEKPLTLTIDEGKRLVKVAKETRRILQTGSQQRSDARFRLACELVRNARIGKLEHVDVWLPTGQHGGPFETAPVPEGFDWDFWLGSTPKVDYVPQRGHRTFRYWWDYSGGTMTDWGAHHNDIALWGLGLERSGPVEIEGKPLVEMIPGGYTAASEYEILYKYANGVTHACRSTRASAWNGAVVDKEGQKHGVKFQGANGWVWVTRGDIQASDPDLLQQELPAGAERLYVSTDHMANFFDCVRSRKPPVCDAEIGHRSVSVCHLGVLAIRLGRQLKWNPKKEQFTGDRDANKWVAREMRKPWDYKMVGG